MELYLFVWMPVVTSRVVLYVGTTALLAVLLSYCCKCKDVSLLCFRAVPDDAIMGKFEGLHKVSVEMEVSSFRDWEV